MISETKEQFCTRYPKPAETRILSVCDCDYTQCTGWKWAYVDEDNLQPVEEPIFTVAERYAIRQMKDEGLVEAFGVEDDPEGVQLLRQVIATAFEDGGRRD